MTITLEASGSVENSDLVSLRINRRGDGTLVAEVVYNVSVLGSQQSRTASWVLSPSEMSAVLGLLPGARQAVQEALGL